MNLREYIQGLNDFVEANPKTLEFTVIYSIDSEGNAFHPIYHEPSIGLYEDSEFTALENFEEDEIDENSENAVCIN